MRREKKLLINSFILSIGSVLPRFSAFLTLPILTTALTKTEYGQYDLILTSISLILPIFSLFIEEGVFRFLLDSDSEINRKSIITNSLIYILISSFFLFLLSLIILKQFTIGIRFALSIYLILELYHRYVLQVCRGMKLLKDYSVTSTLRSLLNLVFIIVLVGINKEGFYGLLISLVLSNFLSTIFLIYRSKLIGEFSLIHHDINCLKKLLGYSVPLIPNSISWWIVSVSDRWIITAILGIEMNAIYAIANKIPSMISIVFKNFNLAWQESATTSYKDDDAIEYYTNVFNHLFNFLVGVLLLLITTSPIIFKILIDDSYFLAYYQMPILFLAMFFSSLSSYYGGIYIALKKTRNIAISSFVSAGLNILINITLISKIGLYAASLSTLVSYLILTVFRAIDTQKYISIEYNFIKLSALSFVIIIIALINYINIHSLNILNFIVAIFITIALNKELIKRIIVNLKRKLMNK